MKTERKDTKKFSAVMAGQSIFVAFKDLTDSRDGLYIWHYNKRGRKLNGVEAIVQFIIDNPDTELVNTGSWQWTQVDPDKLKDPAKMYTDIMQRFLDVAQYQYDKA